MMDDSALRFHGTATENVGGIVAKGLVVPGKEGVVVKHGSAYGVGIYLARNPGV